MLVEALLSLLEREKRTPGFFRDSIASTVDLLPEGLLPQHLLAHLPTGTVRLGEAARQLWPAATSIPASTALAPSLSFTGSRVAIVAQWSAQGVIAPYVLLFLRKLKAEGWRIVLTCGREPMVIPALTRLCDAIVYRDCSGYDFTSWKAALERFPTLFEASELLLTNDSIFAPIGELAPIHEAMRAVPCDFWGLIASRERLPHLQSYYLVFRRAALSHSAFVAFWDAVDRTSDKLETVLRHEVILSPWLAMHGLTPGAYVPFQALPDTNVNPAHYFWKELLMHYGVPILKRDLVREYRDSPFLAGWEKVLERKGYHPSLITDFFKTTSAQ